MANMAKTIFGYLGYWRYTWVCVLFLHGATLSGCAGRVEEESKGAVTQALQAGTYNLELVLPSGTTLDSAMLGADGTLKVGEEVRLTTDEAGTAFASLANNGLSTTRIGQASKVGAIMSRASVVLGARSTAYGNIVSGGTITLQGGAVVTGSRFEQQSLDSARYRFVVNFPPTAARVSVARGQASTLQPGAYARVGVDAGGTVKLTQGRYYVDDLSLERDSILQLDARSGPVVLWVRRSFAFEPKMYVNGPPGNVLVGYLGTTSIAVNTSFLGTLVAPGAPITLASHPTGVVPQGPGRGSFFGRSVFVDGYTTIVHAPFKHWNEILTVEPTVRCIRRFKDGAAALFGYRNTSDSSVTIPKGESNQMTGNNGTVALPTVLQPGTHEKEFWAAFNPDSSVSWMLAGQVATATAATRLCELGDSPVASGPLLPAGVSLAERPGPVPASVLSQLLPDAHTAASSVLPGPIYGRIYATAATPPSSATPGVISQALTGVQVGPGTFDLQVTLHGFNQSEGGCGRVDPYTKLWVNGQELGRTSQASVAVPRSQLTVAVGIEVWDDDSGLCFGDDLLRTYNLVIDNYTGLNQATGLPCTEDLRVCWTATPTAVPTLCFSWNADFIDAGPWNGVGSEDFGASKDVQALPASFARAELTVKNASGVLHEFSGVLDQDGCMKAEDLPAREHWASGTGLQVKASLISQHCLDPSGTSCAELPPACPGPDISCKRAVGANVIVRRGNESGPQKFCHVFAENPQNVNEPDCTVEAISWAGLPPRPLRPTFGDKDSITRTAAVVSQIFKREVETGGELGVQLGMIIRKLDGATGTVDLQVDTFCDITRKDGTVLKTTCRSGNALLLEPDGTRPASARFKYVVAHEFGHFVQGAAMGRLSLNYEESGDPGGVTGQSSRCRCDHVDPDDQLHCLQSLEEPNAAQMEGFGQYFGAKVWNKDLENDCTFVYYKPFLNNACMPGSPECVDSPLGKVSQPPIPVSCREQVKWRNDVCLGTAPSPDLLSFGTEYDWLEFLYAVNNNPVPGERWLTADLYNAYVVACGDGTVGPDGVPSSSTCSGRKVNWAGAGGQTSLTAGVALLKGEISESADAFLRLGREYGVSDEL